MANSKRNKGESKVELLNDYVIVDIETTGLDPKFCSIIEIAALRIKDGNIVDEFQTLVKPDAFCIETGDLWDGIDYIDIDGTTGYFVNDFIIELTGITNAMLKEAPDTSEVLKKFFEFINSDDIIIGHNVNFDINFIYDACKNCFGKDFQNDYVDTMRLSRRTIGSLEHHRLSDLSSFFDIEYENAHRAMNDCKITYECYQRLKDYIQFNNIEITSYKHKSVKSKDITADNNDFDETSPFYQKVFAFTGALKKLTRAGAMQIVANKGGINGDNVTKKTNFLVLGNNDYCPLIKDGKSTKQKKAEGLILKGQDLQIISENVFYDMLEDSDKDQFKDQSVEFGCCSKYLECSDARKCVHENSDYAEGCAYNKNLKNGKIFYGKNRNI